MDNSKLKEQMGKANAGGGSSVMAFETSLKRWYEANKKRLITSLGGNEKEAKKLIVALVYAVNSVPDLVNCSFESIGSCLMQSAQLNLFPDARGECHYLPFKNEKKGMMEAKFIPGFKGLIKLAYNSPIVRSINCGVVYENDLFEYELGSNQFLKHIPNEDDNARGQRSAAWCVAKMAQGDPVIIVKNKKFIEGIKARSKSAKSIYSAWNIEEFIDQQWLKTIIKQATKYIPQATELSEAVKLDDKAEMDEPQQRTSIIQVENLFEGVGTEAAKLEPEALPETQSAEAVKPDRLTEKEKAEIKAQEKLNN